MLLNQRNKEFSDINIINQKLDKLTEENNKLSNQIKFKDIELNEMKLQMKQYELKEQTSEKSKKIILQQLEEKEKTLIDLNKINKDLIDKNKSLENQISNLANQNQELIEIKNQYAMKSEQMNSLINYYEINYFIFLLF